MRPRLLLVLAMLVAIGLVATSSGGASAAAVQLPGPRLAVGVWGGSVPYQRLMTIGPNGEDPQQVARDHETGPEIVHPVWNAAGTELAFIGPGVKAWLIQLVGADGSGPRPLWSSERVGAPIGGWVYGEPVFDPATGGIIVAVVATRDDLLEEERRGLQAKGPVHVQFWELPVDGSKPRLLSDRTRGRQRALIPYPASISSDGTVAATSFTKRGYGVVTIDPHTGATHVVVARTAQWEGSLDPAISPDGSQIVYKVDLPKIGRYGTPVGTSGSDLMIVPTSGGRPHRLAHVKGLIGWPSWDPSGSRIVFTALNDTPRTISSAVAGVGSSIMELNPDGSCLTRVYTVAGGAVQGAAWQPGEGRGAGPISC